MKMTSYDLAECYMVFGGIPFYLDALNEKLSLAQNIDRLFFQRNAMFRDEFDRLFNSIFVSSDLGVSDPGHGCPFFPLEGFNFIGFPASPAPALIIAVMSAIAKYLRAPGAKCREDHEDRGARIFSGRLNGNAAEQAFPFIIS